MLRNLPVRSVLKLYFNAIFWRYVKEIVDVNFTFLTSQKRYALSKAKPLKPHPKVNPAF